jgi:hypothetical protein
MCWQRKSILMDQVENGSFELQEGNESDDSAAGLLYNITRKVTASKGTPHTSAAVPNQPHHFVRSELKKPRPGNAS